MQAVSPKRSTVVVFTVVVLGIIYYLFFHGVSNHQGGRSLRSGHVNWNAIRKRADPPKEDLHDKWIVLTTINSPTDDVKKLAKIEGWKVVVVGDTKTPKDWRY